MSGLFGQSVVADKRVALVIGNSNCRSLGRLPNAASDALMLADTFAKLDIVTLCNDLTATEMPRVLREFADNARSADIAVRDYLNQT
jgi:uncharacterized caspase-like protein